MSGFKKKSLPLCALWGTALALSLTAALTAVITWCAVGEALTAEQAQACLFGAVFLAVFLAAAITARGRGRNYICCGLACAGGYIVSALAIYALGIENIDFGVWFMRIIPAALGAGLLGGVISIRQNTRGKKRGKRRL